VTLPPAATESGMIVFVKKVDSTANAVHVTTSGSDKIENKTLPVALAKPLDSLELISDGSGNWYVFDSSECNAFVN
jgi:hypothetical protein